jgi:hypothetical protein
MHNKNHKIQPSEQQLLRELHELTSRQYVYEDLWCGMVPFDGNLTELQTGPPVAFADLTWREQADVLRSFIAWDHYPERAWDDDYTIRENIQAGLPLDAWLKGTSLSQSFQHLADGKTPPPVQREPDLTWEGLPQLLFSPDNPQAANADSPDQTPAPADENPGRQDATPATLNDQLPGTVHFQGFTCEIQCKTYPSGRPALYLVDAQSGDTVAVATAELPSVPLRPGETLIKDHSENRGMLQALTEAGIVQATGETVRSGFAEVPIVTILHPSLNHSLRDQLFGATLPAPTPEPASHPEHTQNHRHKL